MLKTHVARGALLLFLSACTNEIYAPQGASDDRARGLSAPVGQSPVGIEVPVHVSDLEPVETPPASENEGGDTRTEDDDDTVTVRDDLDRIGDFDPIDVGQVDVTGDPPGPGGGCGGDNADCPPTHERPTGIESAAPAREPAPERIRDTDRVIDFDRAREPDRTIDLDRLPDLDRLRDRGGPGLGGFGSPGLGR